MLATELSRRIQELAANTRADNDKIAAVFRGPPDAV